MIIVEFTGPPLLRAVMTPNGLWRVTGADRGAAQAREERLRSDFSPGSGNDFIIEGYWPDPLVGWADAAVRAFGGEIIQAPKVPSRRNVVY